MKSFSVFLCISAMVWTCLGNQNGVHPGIKAKLTSKGLDFASDVVLGFAENAIQKIKLPSISGSTPVEYNVNSLMIETFNLGNTKFRTKTPNLFIPAIDKGTISASARFSASKTFKIFNFPFTLRADGGIRASASGLHLSQEFALKMAKNGKPTFLVEACSARIEDLDIKVFDTKLDAVFNIVLELFKETIKEELEKRICPAVKKTLSSQASKVANSFIVNYPFLLETSVDLGLVCDPEATENELMISVKGRCYPSDNPDLEFPFVTTALPRISSSAQMARVSFSPYAVNTLAYSLWKLGKLEGTFNVGKLGSLGVGDLGSVLPPLAIIGDNPLQIEVRATHPPRTEFTPDGIRIEGTVEVVLNAVMPDGSILQALTVISDIELLAKARIENQTISGRASYLDVRVSDAGELPAELFNQLLQAFLPQAILPAINGIAETGYEIPSLYGYDLINASVEHKLNALEVGADLKQN
ncbi:unnamed protein product [Clavelina lepadiformis]|uniref:Lipid-binding serum glycoprotein C-terminal domain-containing protein n=1 Tax=Clavelina lepadiformis TaxID=159417 RepID=A0ABP0FGM2_CLALP